MIKILIFLIVISIGLAVKFKDKLILKSNKSKLNDFKLNADKVLVDLTIAEIKSNSWTEEVITDNSNYAGLNQLTGQSEKNFKLEEKILNHVKVKTKYNGKNIEYGTNVNMDTDNLKIHLSIQKETYLYIDPKNIENKYLDLEFLEK